MAGQGEGRWTEALPRIRLLIVARGSGHVAEREAWEVMAGKEGGVIAEAMRKETLIRVMLLAVLLLWTVQGLSHC